jgi:defect-in-organelle-trafficking protein DotC
VQITFTKLKTVCGAAAFAAMLLLAGQAFALDTLAEGETPAPPELVDLENLPGGIPPVKTLNADEDKTNAFVMDMRRKALKEAALSYGARGGLAHRTFHIRNELETRTTQLDKTFDFRQLLIPAPSGLLIEPPIISENVNALIIEGSGQEAAVSDRVYQIIRNARIVSAPRHWRNYLERDWGVVTPPPEILRPKNNDERKVWRDLTEKGWIEGRTQADEVFEQDLSKLSAEFNGMVRYRKLLAQGMVSPPFAQQIDRGVTGTTKSASVGGQSVPVTSTMRVGDRAVVITGVPELITGSEQWQPASR